MFWVASEVLRMGLDPQPPRGVGSFGLVNRDDSQEACAPSDLDWLTCIEDLIEDAVDVGPQL